MDERKQPAALYIVVILGVLACYILGLGPACRLSSRFGGEKFVTVAYSPVTFVAEATNNVALMDAIRWYSRDGTSISHQWIFSPDSPGHAKWTPFLFDVDYADRFDVTLERLIIGGENEQSVIGPWPRQAEPSESR